MAFKKRLQPSVEFSAASISDLVFLLLIFFLLTSNFVTTSAVEVDLPRTEGGRPPQGEATVTIAANGSYYWNDEELAPDGSRAEKEAQIVAKIDEYLADTSAENRVVNFRGDTAISYGAAAVIVAAVSKSGGAVAMQTRQ